MELIDKDALVAKIEKSVKLLFENNDRLYDEYGNYFYKNAENDYRFYHKLDEYDWDEDRMTLTDLTEYLFHFKTIEAKEANLEKEYKDFVEKDPVYNKLVNGIVGKAIAKHFFELGLRVSKGE